ncbi:MAG: hypothetical protein ACM3NS_04620 [Deltaproteobacteria bacterium]
MTARDLPPRIKAAVLVSAPFAAWLDMRIREQMRQYGVQPRPGEAAYLRALERTWSFAHDFAVILVVCVLSVVCVEALAHFFRGE